MCHILPTDWLFIQENRFWRRSVMIGVGRCGQYQGNEKSNGQIHEDILNQYIVSTMIESINQLFATLWCSGRVPSPNDAIQTRHVTIPVLKTKREPTIVSAAPKDAPLFLNPRHRSGTKLFGFSKFTFNRVLCLISL